MKLGVNLPNFGPATTPEVLLSWARKAEDLGFHTLLVSDHVALTDDANGRSPAPFYEAFTTLAWLAGQTTTLHLGTGVVIAPHRHPLLLARTASTLDTLSGERLVLGVGVGWTRLAFEALGVPFHLRGRLTDQTLEALRALGSADVVEVNGNRVHTGPLPRRRTPVWVGGNSPAALRRAVRFGDAWHPLWPRIPVLAQVKEVLPKLAAEFGRPVPALAPRIALDLTERALPEQSRYPGQGTVEQVRADFHALAALGVEHVVVDTDTGDQRRRRPVDEELDLLEALVRQVIDPRTGTVR